MSRIALAATAATFVAAGALPVRAGIIGSVGASTLDGLVAMLVPAIVGGLLVLAPRLTERYAAPARAKGSADRTLLDRAAIKADVLVDAQIAQIDRAHLQEFLTNFVLEKLHGLGDLSALDPVRTADGLVTEALEKLTARNPAMAKRANLNVNAASDLLAGAIQRMALDPLSASLAAAGANPVAPASR